MANQKHLKILKHGVEWRKSGERKILKYCPVSVFRSAKPQPGGRNSDSPAWSRKRNAGAEAKRLATSREAAARFVPPAEAGSGFIKPAYPGLRLRLRPGLTAVPRLRRSGARATKVILRSARGSYDQPTATNVNSVILATKSSAMAVDGGVERPL